MKKETGLDYFGARYYDSKYGRWMSVDPLADKYPGLSPYNYCLNNPLGMVDPNGDSVVAHGQNPGQALSFLQEWAGADGNRLSMGQNGMLQINTEGYETGSNPDLDALVMINNAEDRIGIETTTDATVQQPDNQSKTSRFAGSPDKTRPHGSIPPGGFDGNVRFQEKAAYTFENTGNQIPRGQIVGHEMVENYCRTHFGANYQSAHTIANQFSFGGWSGKDQIKVDVKNGGKK